MTTAKNHMDIGSQGWPMKTAQEHHSPRLSFKPSTGFLTNLSQQCDKSFTTSSILKAMKMAYINPEDRNRLGYITKGILETITLGFLSYAS